MRIARVPALLLLVVAGFLAMSQPANAADPQPDVAYLNTAHQLNLTIIDAAHTATTKGRTTCVRRVAGQLERDHRKLSAQELDVATRLNILLPTAPSAAQRRQLDLLAAKAGTKSYDAAWLAFQRQVHQQYLALVEGELPISASPAVEAVADGAKPVIQMHQRAITGTCKAETTTPVVPTGEGGQEADAKLARTRAALILMGIGVVLLLVGKAIPVKRRLLGMAALAAGLIMLFGGQPNNTGKVPDAGKTTADREAAVPPVRLKLPGVLEATVQPVATGATGQLQVPQSAADVGWWAAGAAPGAVGGTVLLAGHVDTVKGRGVFAPLSEVPVGTRVAVTGGDGDEHWYRIVARRTYKQQALPADLFHGAAKPRLALVTCTGSYDHKTHRYSENLVLYGVPVD
ncbi:DUF4142 domain-containing protein [Kribbella sindirgiensis]|uniref:DUF4142 domain-containing protein n=1 Tax=Kribbella sindirgiensis TaxID=1124744 RepID=A0A4R0IMF8_9ACTN|nr:DUF4142 domain-containing protein [Kribbella sindirgiensis]TCC29875.1 DUF4142 domain-containing protein [Kribbella sindirgiensis]